MRRRLVVAALFVAVGAIALAVGLRVGAAPDGVGKGADTLLAIALPDAYGKEQRLDQWRGKVLVVNFWATWCAPCKQEMPLFIKAQEEFGKRGVQFIGVAVDEATKVRAFAEEIHLNYPALIGGFGSMELSKTYGNTISALPFTVIIDRAGRVAHTQLGPVPDAELHGILAKLL